MGGVLASLAKLLPWQIWVLTAIGLFSFFMAIRQTWFPDGFRKKTIDEFLTDHQDKIRDAIQENVGVVLLRKIQYLYPKLQEWGIQMPEIRPFVDTNRGRNFHIGLLKDLDFQITKLKDGVPFDLKRWGETVSLRENDRDVLVKEEKAGGLLNELELQMLRLIYDQLPDRVVTNSTVYCHKPFLEVSPGVLCQALVHLTSEEYIDAAENESANPFAPASARPWTIHRVTEKGRFALLGSGHETVSSLEKRVGEEE